MNTTEAARRIARGIPNAGQLVMVCLAVSGVLTDRFDLLMTALALSVYDLVRLHVMERLDPDPRERLLPADDDQDGEER